MTEPDRMAAMITRIAALESASQDHATLHRSFDWLESLVGTEFSPGESTPETARIVEVALVLLEAMGDDEFVRMVAHSAYIPEHYAADSSHETLYSKLVECVVFEWARRLGFSASALPTAKSSKEDVTIADDDVVIVCDAKAFRLGRSQPSPNVKDALKEGDMAKWLRAYPEDARLGGLVCFPRLHDWKKGSDYYSYLTNHRNVICSLHYEQLAFLLLLDDAKSRIVQLLRAYEEIFPLQLTDKSTNRSVYVERINAFLFSDVQEEWSRFHRACERMGNELIRYTAFKIDQHVEAIEEEAAALVLSLSDEDLRARLTAELAAGRSASLLRQRGNIEKFRSITRIE